MSLTNVVKIYQEWAAHVPMVYGIMYAIYIQTRETLLIHAIPVLIFVSARSHSGIFLNYILIQKLVFVLVPPRCWDILLRGVECWKWQNTHPWKAFVYSSVFWYAVPLIGWHTYLCTPLNPLPCSEAYRAAQCTSNQHVHSLSHTPVYPAAGRIEIRL